MSSIIVPVIVVLILSAFYIYHQLVPNTWSWWARGLAFAVILGLALCLPAQFYLRFAMRQEGIHTTISIVNYAFGFYSLLLTFTILHGIFWRIFKFTPTHKHLSDDRRNFLRQGSRVGVLGVTSAVFGYAAQRALANPTVKQFELPIRNLPAALVGLRIGQISDVHIGQLQGEDSYTQKIIAAVNALNVDIMTVTGDVVDGSVARLKQGIAPLAQLQSKYGTYFVTGNHEYYSGAPEWIEQFKSLGWRVLGNEHDVLSIANHPVVIAGVHDLKAGQHIAAHTCNPSQALLNAPQDAAFTLLLAHHPGTAELTEGLPIDLQLSGHTHAGQYFPATWVIQYFHKFARGLNKNNGGWVYVNSGTGYWGPPLRTTDISGEITLITLTQATA